MNAFCASENFDAFIVFRSSPARDVIAENSTFERSTFQRADHGRCDTERPSAAANARNVFIVVLLLRRRIE
ncbi:MAG: hypothetical protein ABS35_26815 [Kaistia sp. SCN 65-12]|nr:MAG: hypothetical protein ABS35_26815 [Kaistia sp. SCN 65-12]